MAAWYSAPKDRDRMQGGRILIVDDEPMVRETIAQVLRDEGYAVEVADDGRDALLKLDAHRPDAVLLDLMMPGMNGRQFLTALREDRGDATLPVVVMTAVHGVGERALSLGATDIVEKPFDVDDLLGKIALAVYRSRDTHADSGDLAAAAPASHTDVAPTPSTTADKGVVFLLHHDRDALQRLDRMLSSRGYAVVSMARITPQLPRLARVLAPRAILLDLDCPGGGIDIVATLRAEATLDSVPILLFSRADTALAIAGVGEDAATAGVPRSIDEELVRVLEGGGRAPTDDADASR